jgi:cyclohexadienyl dehydratase
MQGVRKSFADFLVGIRINKHCQMDRMNDAAKPRPIVRCAFRTVFACALIVIATSAAALGHAGAGEVLDRIHATGVLRVGTTGDYRPFSFRQPDGSYQGADIDMARRLAARLGVKAEFVPTRWSELKADYLARRFDIAVGGISVTPERSALGPFAHTLMEDGKRPIVRCADRARYRSLDALNQPQVRVIVNPGASNEAFARASLPAARLSVFADNGKIFEEIAQGRADAMVTDGIEVDQQVLLHRGVLCPADVAAPFTRMQKGFWLQPDPEFSMLVNSWLDSEIKSGSWRRSLDRALGHEPARR